MAALSASICLAMASAACSPETRIIYAVPKLNDQDRARLSCAAFPEIREVLEAQPEHVFLSGSNGKAVVTDGQYKWVRFDIANRREARLIEFGDLEARQAHFECFDDLNWTEDLITDLEE